ncbi:uncharacterized protein LOC107272459 [Cephus cinctus]|uniref:Uncharacterized protein LOC107272459 n=1 Tax=Cephus cinctus TaxID=211228 RepID=A0AAJ7C9D0_CEPCN|nr:uncharacterized protein LOC107272459 [Cephus cinctus]
MSEGAENMLTRENNAEPTTRNEERPDDGNWTRRESPRSLDVFGDAGTYAQLGVRMVAGPLSQCRSFVVCGVSRLFKRVTCRRRTRSLARGLCLYDLVDRIEAWVTR